MTSNTSVREFQQQERRIQTIRALIYDGEVIDTLANDDKITALMMAGWTVANVSIVAYTDTSGDYAVHVVERYTTLTR